jgi:sugar phosphate isomerase/epimerase
MKLGLVTYNLACKWDVDTIIKNCAKAGFAGVELRTTHAHKVEVDLTAEQRREVRKKFADSPVDLYGLGTAFEFHSPEAHIVKQNIEGTKRYLDLAKEVGAEGVKVRPNGLATQQGVAEKDTLKQIGQAYAECAEYARQIGMQIWMEVHGRDTSDPRRMRAILDAANHPTAKVCWNSNDADKDKDGKIDWSLKLIGNDIVSAHINELWRDYPYVDLFAFLLKRNYTGYTSAEIPENADGVRIMQYYRALWLELVERAKAKAASAS